MISTDDSTVKPYAASTGSKKEQVAEMFNNISGSYDFLNHFFSLGIDHIWRKKAVKLLAQNHPKSILDVACGTGDFTVALNKLDPERIVGLDISEGMLNIGRKKISKKGLVKKVELILGDSEEMPFPNGSFDVVTAAFGVRNFENLEKGLQEMYRVTAEGGTTCILEFSKPLKFPWKQMFRFYFHFIMPLVGKLVSKDSRAYTYLPESVDAFPHGEGFVQVLKSVGFSSTEIHPVSGAIATIYLARKV